MTTQKLVKSRKNLLTTKSFLLWSLALAFLIFNVYFSLQTVAYGSQLSALEQDEERISKENKILSNKLVGDTSLTKISERSEELGFEQPSQTLYLSKNDSVTALR